jgi:alkaline phosphatase D
MSFRAPSPRSPNPNVFDIDRRKLICGLAAGSLGAFAGPAIVGRALAQSRRWTADPFSLGVASGAPRPDGFVLWTRLAPEPLSANPATPGGMTGSDVPVAYEIAGDEAMRGIVAAASPTLKRPTGGRSMPMFRAWSPGGPIGTGSCAGMRSAGWGGR